MERVHKVVVDVSTIATASPAIAHQASQNTNDIGPAALAYAFVRKVCARSSVENEE